jgi:phosphomannomutase
MNNPIISVSGVRGIVGESLTPDIVLKFGISYGTYIKGNKRIVVGKDTRITGDMVVNALISGLLSVGCEVTYLGIAPTPTVQFLTRKLNFDGGIVVSASHNPIEWNAFKFYKKGGMLFDIRNI